MAICVPNRYRVGILRDSSPRDALSSRPHRRSVARPYALSSSRHAAIDRPSTPLAGQHKRRNHAEPARKIIWPISPGGSSRATAKSAAMHLICAGTRSIAESAEVT